MSEYIMNFYGDIIFIYSMGMIVSYVILIWLAAITIIRNKTVSVESYAKKSFAGAHIHPECQL